MKYWFTVHRYTDNRDGLEKQVPLLNIHEPEKYGWFFLNEIANLSYTPGYLKEIVSKLEALLNGETTFYEGFGFEVYMIECNQEIAKVINIFDNDKVEAEIPTREIYELMRDWKDYLESYARDF